MKWLVKIITDLIARKFYGELVIKFESGKVVKAYKTESLQPE